LKNHLPNGKWPLQETSFSGINGAVSGVAASFVRFGLTQFARKHELAQLMEANNKILLGTMETMMDERMETMKTKMETMMDEKLETMKTTMETMMDEKLAMMDEKLETMMDEMLDRKLVQNNVLLIDAIRETIKLRD
jgi:hypothetical protein